MRPFALLALSLSLLLAVLFAGAINSPVWVPSRAQVPALPPNSPVAVCFAPGTPPEYMAEWQARIEARGHLDYRIGDRWDQTATNPQTGPRGTPITLTYSFPPDGIDVDGQPNELWAMMNAEFGSPAVWQAKFASAFADWSRVSGIHYVQVTDDGAAWPNTRGILGSRGDVRIVASSIDGQWGILAYDFFPDWGDMMLDADENWGAPGQNFIWLRNIVRHEHGHGFGLSHVCPINETKLMEPFYSSAFDGPQHDDIRGAQRNYGDRCEENDNTAAATRLETIGQDTTVRPLSIDGTNDVDFYKFSIPAGQGFRLICDPDGGSYLEDAQNEDGSCGGGSMINSRDRLNLDLRLYSASGSTLLAESANHPAGEAEQFFHYMVQPAGDSFMTRIVGTGTNDVQLYTLQFSLFNLGDPYLSLCPVDFDTLPLGSQATRITRIVNPSAAALSVFSISLDGPFTVEPTGPHTIAAHDSLTLTVGYAATEAGFYSGTLSVFHSGPGGELACTVSAMAVSSWLQIVLSPNVDFGDVPLGTTDSARVPVRAQGNASLTIQSVTVAPPFSLVYSLPVTLLPQEAISLSLRFTPTELGLAEGTALIYHTGTDSPDTLFLRGTCIPGAADERPGALPAVFRVGQNYPNPFNSATRISFDLPRAARVSLQVYDVQGRRVRELAAEELAAGRHSLLFDASGLSSGVYLYRVISPEWSGTGKMMLLK